MNDYLLLNSDSAYRFDVQIKNFEIELSDLEVLLNSDSDFEQFSRHFPKFSFSYSKSKISQQRGTRKNLSCSFQDTSLSSLSPHFKEQNFKATWIQSVFCLHIGSLFQLVKTWKEFGFETLSHQNITQFQLYRQQIFSMFWFNTVAFWMDLTFSDAMQEWWM